MTRDWLAAARGAPQRHVCGVPRGVLTGTVVANVYPGGLDRLPGCLGAAVYRVPGRRRGPGQAPHPDTYWLVAVYRGPDHRHPQGLEAFIGEAEEPEPPAAGSSPDRP